MPTFTYRALTRDGDVVQAVAHSESEATLRTELSQQGYYVESIKKRAVWFFGRRNKFSPATLALFNQEFVALLKAGLPILDILEIVAESTDEPALKLIIEKIHDRIRDGASMSVALASSPELFDSMYISAVETGEKSGNLIHVLEKYQDWLKRRVQVMQKLSSALTYPIFLLATMAMILVILFVFVMPRFTAMYAQFGSELPAATRMLQGFVHSFPVWGPSIGLVLLILYIAYRRRISSESGLAWRDAIVLRLPYIGMMARYSALIQFGSMLSVMLSAGTPLVSALKTTARSIKNRSYGTALLDVARQVSEGSALTAALTSQGLLTPTAKKLIEAGEASGSLDVMLEQVSSYYDEVLDHRLAKITSLVEPAVMLLMGVMVGVIIIVMYLPIFNMANIIR